MNKITKQTSRAKQNPKVNLRKKKAIVWKTNEFRIQLRFHGTSYDIMQTTAISQ